MACASGGEISSFSYILTVEGGRRRQANHSDVVVNVPVERAVLRVVADVGRLEGLANAVKRLRDVQRAQVHRHALSPKKTNNKSTVNLIFIL